MTDTSTAIVLPERGQTVEYRDTGIESRWDYAKRISAGGDILPRAFTGIIDQGKPTQRQGIIPGKVFLIMETGRMLGVDPMAAIAGINVIDGSASISPALMQALVRRAGHKLRVRLSGSIETGDISATATLTRADDPEPFEVTWTIQDAIRARLVDSYEPDSRTGLWAVKARSKDGNPLPWETYTRSLLKWRAQGEVVRDGAEEVLLGIHYAPEELGAFIRDDGTADVDSVAEYEAREEDALTRVKALADKAQAQALVDALVDEGVWTNRVEAEFTAHVATLPDSRPARAGAPGQTGDPDLDRRPDEQSDRLAREGAERGIKRQCSLGYHDECSDTPERREARGEDLATSTECKCPCHGSASKPEEETEEERLQRIADEADEAAAADYDAEHPAREPIPAEAATLDLSALDKPKK